MTFNKKTKVINITGWGRNGSTILGKILGEIDGFFFGGEIRTIWNKVLPENRLCGCGTHIKECTLWKSVFQEAFNGIENIDIDKMKSLCEKYLRNKNIPCIFLPGVKSFINSNLSFYMSNHGKLLNGLSHISNSRVIIDTSKSPIYGLLLSQMKDIDPYFIHLVRDPRGIAYSRQKKMLVQPDENQPLIMKQENPVLSSLLWNLRNTAAEHLCKNLKNKYLFFRYDDFILNPKATITKILDLVNEKSSSLPFTSDHEVKLGGNHSVWGNPNRFESGTVKLKLDEEWKENLNKKDRLISTLITFPLLKKYGYKLIES